MFPDPNITTAVQYVQYANTVTNNLFWNFFIIVLAVIVFIGLKSFKTEAALSATCFFMTIVAFLLWLLGLSSSTFIIVFCVITGASFFFLV